MHLISHLKQRISSLCHISLMPTEVSGVDMVDSACIAHLGQQAIEQVQAHGLDNQFLLTRT